MFTLKIHKEVGERKKAYWCVKEWPKQEYSIAYELGFACLVFVVPLAVMTFAYVNICRELWTVTAWRTTMRTAE